MITLLLHKVEEEIDGMIMTVVCWGEHLGKDIGIWITEQGKEKDRQRKEKITNNPLLRNTSLEITVEIVRKSDWIDMCEQKEVALLVLQTPQMRRRKLMPILKELRNLRCPYLFYKKEFLSTLEYKNILLPIGFLSEEKEKAQYAIAFGRFFGAKITLFVAKDYGTRAKRNADAVQKLLEKISLSYNRLQADVGSFDLDKFAVQIAQTASYDLVIVSVTRVYGLDDVIFGPKEYHLLKRTTSPLLFVNPRSDLYTFCQ